ncbi:MAG: OmpA family protein [Pseudomonadota bacterium]
MTLPQMLAVRRVLAAIAVAASISGGMAAAAAIEPPPGMESVGTRSEASDRADLPIGPGATDRLALDGEVAIAAWRSASGSATPPSPAAMLSDYRQALATAGWDTVFACVDADCGGVERRFGLTLLPAPTMLVDTADMALLTLSHDAEGEGGEASAASHLSLVASRVLGKLYLQATLVKPPGAADPPLRAAEAGEDEVAPTPLPPSAAEEVAGPATNADTLAEQLIGEGHLALDGLEFESGTASIAASSTAAIARAAAVLEAAPDLLVAVVGHSDNDGALEGNIALSRRRAEAVRDALVASGVAANRLEAHGIGWLAPIASNGSPEGRARNRRVELVLR